MSGKLLWVAIALSVAAAVQADVPGAWVEVRENIVPHGRSTGLTGTCSIVYFNICSGWLWVYGRSADGARMAEDEVGVVFDLPADCGKDPSETCANLEFWWYWRYTVPGWGFTVTYDLWDVDSDRCKVGSSLGTLPHQDPMERWNHYPGLGATTSDLVAIIVTMDNGAYPRWVADNNVRNSQAPVACAGWPGPQVSRSFSFGGQVGQFCPPEAAPFLDALGPVQLLMDATFSCGETSIEPVSWGSIKTLFR
ncbi:MAG: hypothetical protein ABIH26_06040 [Candidatus Eisenbacteria bacterium]